MSGTAPAAGAMPQTEQKPSSIVPVQPGRAQRPSATATGGGAAAAALAGAPTDAPTAAGATAGAIPQTEQKPSSIVPVQPGRAHAVMASSPSR